MNLEEQLNELAELSQTSPIAWRLSQQMLATDDVAEVLQLTLSAFLETEKNRQASAKGLFEALQRQANPRPIILHHSEVTS